MVLIQTIFIMLMFSLHLIDVSEWIQAATKRVRDIHLTL